MAFETVAFFGLQYLTSGLGEANQYQPENTIVSNWVKTMVFVVAHLALVIAAMLVLSNRLPRRYRGQVMGWFYLALLMSFVLLIPLFGLYAVSGQKQNHRCGRWLKSENPETWVCGRSVPALSVDCGAGRSRRYKSSK